MKPYTAKGPTKTGVLPRLQAGSSQISTQDGQVPSKEASSSAVEQIGPGDFRQGRIVGYFPIHAQ